MFNLKPIHKQRIVKDNIAHACMKLPLPLKQAKVLYRRNEKEREKRVAMTETLNAKFTCSYYNHPVLHRADLPQAYMKEIVIFNLSPL